MSFRYCHSLPRRGMLLFIVAIILVILCLGGLSLLMLMRTENEAASMRGLELQLNAGAKSAVALVQELLDLSILDRESLGGVYHNPNLFCSVPLLGTDDGAKDEIYFTLLAPEFRATKIEALRYGLANESARLHLGAILDWDREEPGIGREVLMKLPGMTQTQADSMLDWIDSDENPRQQGAESPWYRAKGLPYSPREALPVFLEELLLVRDVTRLQLYGDDATFNFCKVKELIREGGSELVGTLQRPPRENSVESFIEEQELQGGRDLAGGNVVPWSYLLTVFSAEKDVMPETGQEATFSGNDSAFVGLMSPSVDLLETFEKTPEKWDRARIDLNAANLQFLHQELVSFIDREMANFIVLYRQFGPSSESSGGAMVSARNIRPDFNRPASFTLVTPLDIITATVLIPDEGGQPSRVVQSPFASSRPEAKKLFSYLDVVSTFPTTVVPGRVNINEAPQVILRALPYLTAGEVERIIASRPQSGVALSAEYRHATWLLTREIITLEKMKKLFNKITTGGDVLRGHLVAYTPNRGTFIRAEVVIDGTVTPARQVFYKDLTTYGIGFTKEILGDPVHLSQDETALAP